MSERVLIGSVNTEQDQLQAQTSLAELRLLVQTAGGEVIREVVQNLPQLNAKTLFGSGKVQEIKHEVDINEIDTVVVNQSLTPRQRIILEEALEVKVIDRTQLILDIFALHAQSKIGKLQVELAQIEYMLPQLSSLTSDLSRLGGGIGTRGPGETKLEHDRRVLNKQKSHLKKELAKMTKHRALLAQDKKRNQLLKVGLVGYTNAGKTTLLNQVTAAEAMAADKLFATLDPLTRQFNFATGLQATLTDTVGFIQDLPTTLIEAFKSTLEESQQMDFLLHVVDANNPNREQQEQTVLKILHDLKIEHTPILTVYTKTDLAPDFQPTLFPYVAINNKQKNVKEHLQQAIIKVLADTWTPFTAEITIAESYQLAKLKQHALVTKEEFDESTNTYHVQGYRLEK